jgi:hypothetical protein
MILNDFFVLVNCLYQKKVLICAKLNVHPYWCLHPKEIIPLRGQKVTSNFLVHLVCRLASIHLSQESLVMEMLYGCDTLLLLPGEALSHFFRDVVISPTATCTATQDPTFPHFLWTVQEQHESWLHLLRQFPLVSGF